MIHLDANFLVAALKPGTSEEAKMTQWFAANESVGISAIAWGEFRCGPLSNRDEVLSRQMFPAIESVSGQDGEMAAQLFNQTGRRSRSFPDCTIAAVAIRRGAKLATINLNHFRPFVQFGLVLA